MAKAKEKYLIRLDDFSGDTVYMVVGKAAFDWIESQRPPQLNLSGHINERIPEAVLEEATQQPEYKTVTVTSGSCENDRAIALMNLFECLDKKPRGKFAGEWVGVLY